MKRSIHDLPCLFLLLVALTGCFTAEAPRSYSVARGVLVSTVRAPLDETWVARDPLLMLCICVPMTFRETRFPR